MSIRVYFLALSALGMSAFLLLHFGLILIYGQFLIFESNLPVLILEIGLTAAIMIFGFYCVISELKKGRNI
ncbi:MAG: hypothetical protein WC370_04860 [Dehalococcoidales bacterium]|jgi:hypothetical protein